MAKPKRAPKNGRNHRVSGQNENQNGSQRVFELSDEQSRLLRRIGLKIHKRLFEQERSVERLALDLGLARSTLREIIAGRSNARILTLSSIAHGLGYRDLIAFLQDL